MYKRQVKRIDDVVTLRAAQFPEDAGPMAHPIRPDSYQEIGNFYTATVYEKGAEVIRMQHTLLGEAGFRAGMDEYFRRHDGQAVDVYKRQTMSWRPPSRWLSTITPTRRASPASILSLIHIWATPSAWPAWRSRC